MSNELSKKDDIFSVPIENMNIDTIKMLLEIFNFNIPDEQLQHIQISSFKKWRITFINNFTKETISAYYTDECPAYDNNCSRTILWVK